MLDIITNTFEQHTYYVILDSLLPIILRILTLIVEYDNYYPNRSSRDPELSDQ